MSDKAGTTERRIWLKLIGLGIAEVLFCYLVYSRAEHKTPLLIPAMALALGAYFAIVGILIYLRLLKRR